MRPGELHPGLRIDPALTVRRVTADIADQLDVAFLATPLRCRRNSPHCSRTAYPS